jgi:hypothetical protein
MIHFILLASDTRPYNSQITLALTSELQEQLSHIPGNIKTLHEGWLDLSQEIETFTGFMDDDAITRLTQQKTQILKDLVLLDTKYHLMIKLGSTTPDNVLSLTELQSKIKDHLLIFSNSLDVAIRTHLSWYSHLGGLISEYDSLSHEVLSCLLPKERQSLEDLWKEIITTNNSMKDLLKKEKFSRESLTQLLNLKEDLEKRLKEWGDKAQIYTDFS